MELDWDKELKKLSEENPLFVQEISLSVKDDIISLCIQMRNATELVKQLEIDLATQEGVGSLYHAMLIMAVNAAGVE